MNSLARMTMVRSATQNETEARRRRDSRGRYTSEMENDTGMNYEGSYRNGYGSPRMGDDEEKYRRKWTITENNRNRSGDYRSEYMNTYPTENGNSPMEGDPTRGPSRGSRQYEEMETGNDREKMRMAYNRYYGDGSFRGESEGRRMIGYGGATEAHYDYPSDEGSQRREKQRGYSHSESVAPLDKDTAKEWVASMRNLDGSERGEHWSYDQAKALMQQHGWKHKPVDWYAILHAVYYDYCGVAKKFGQDKNTAFYAELAHAWLDDPDAVEDKAAIYYSKIAEH